ncbi:hypothetical protein B0H67DRAFT_601121 [Lasiosphaeris hirsuta]|uniref:Autophagy-related protein 33 n=1 Tax=Lasiosphaeris hirsuta TaxID=260670 RepID=A0AA40DU43_9PEZI|nr:hypothetical protein B0H67DRAFT_601121 [Lasiosphaeris hirsuta]
MAARGVSLLKFVGTVSLGLLTGLSYTLSTLTIPALLTLPSADAASRAFDALTITAKRHLSTLSTVSGTAFYLAFFFSPRPFRHPYLLYTSLLIFGSQVAVSDLVAPYLYLGPAPASSSSSSSSAAAAAAAAAAARKQQAQLKKDRAAARARAMEASYEVLGAGSDAHSEGAGSASGEELDVEEEHASVNGEEVRVKVEEFLKKQIVQSAVAGLGFLLAVVGIWGDGVAPVFAQSVVIEV